MSLPWHLLQYPEHAGVKALIQDLNRIYSEEPALHELDHHPEGFEWIDHLDSAHSFFAFIRRGQHGGDLVVAVNATPVPREKFRLGVPQPGFYEEILNSDSERYAGSNLGNGGGRDAEFVPAHGRDQSIAITLPPLSTIIFRRR